MRGFKVKVTKDGQIVVEAFGFKGPACLKATRKLLEQLGRAEIQKKPEFYEEEEVRHENWNYEIE